MFNMIMVFKKEIINLSIGMVVFKLPDHWLHLYGKSVLISSQENGCVITYFNGAKLKVIWNGIIKLPEHMETGLLTTISLLMY